MTLPSDQAVLVYLWISRVLYIAGVRRREHSVALESAWPTGCRLPKAGF